MRGFAENKMIRVAWLWEALGKGSTSCWDGLGSRGWGGQPVVDRKQGRVFCTKAPARDGADVLEEPWKEGVFLVS
jgi:hypothetical protein